MGTEETRLKPILHKFLNYNSLVDPLGEFHRVEMAMKQVIFLSMCLFIMEYSLTF